MQENAKIFVISGPSGAGKNAVLDGLCAKSGNIAQTISATTRSPRSDEVDGKDYYFVSQEDFLEKIDRNEFIEYVMYGKNYYGTLKSEVERLTELNKTVIVIIEVRGAQNFKSIFPESKTIFIVPPSVEELRRRIKGRGQNTEEEIDLRLNIALEEMKQRDKYDYCVVNDELADCIEAVYDIIK